MLVTTVWIRHVVGVITHCSISLGMPCIHSLIRCFKSPIWRDVFCILCFWCSPRGSRMVLQDEASGQARWCQWNEKWVHPEIACKSVLCGQLLHTSMSMTTFSLKAPFSVHAGFKMSNTFRCSRHTWPACMTDLAVPDYLLWGYVKSNA
jgi:hypothetical protein